MKIKIWNFFDFKIMVILMLILAFSGNLVFAGEGGQDYYDNFERGDVAGSIWDNVILSSGNTATIDNSVFYSGSSSLKFSFNSANSAYIQKELTASPPTAIDLSFRFRMDSALLNDGDPVYLGAVRDQDGFIFATFYYTISGGDRYFQIDYRRGDGTWNYGAGTHTFILSPDVWHHLHIKVNVAGTEGISWSINEQNIYSNQMDLYATSITHLDVGVVDSEYTSTGSLYLDDVRWNNSTTDVEALDRGRVSFTFDDGLISNYTVLKPILDQYGIKASFYIVTEYQEDAAAYAMTVANLTELKSQGHQIQSHSHDHVNLTTLSQADRMTSLSTSKTLLEGWGFTVFLFTLPFGAYNDQVLADTLAAGYAVISTTDEGYNNISSIAAKTRIMRIDADLYTPAQLNTMIDEAMSKKLWIILYYHKITGTGPGEVVGDENHTPDEIKAVIDHVKNNDYDVALQETINSYPTTNSDPTNISVSPADATGSQSQFVLNYSDPDGHSDLANLYFLVNSSTAKTNTCYLKYDVVQDLFFLRDNANSSWGSGVAPGSTTLLSNSQVDVDLEDASYVKNSSNGSDVTLTLSISFKLTFAGEKNLYLQAEDVHGAQSALSSKGTFGANQYEVLVRTVSGGSTNKDGVNYVSHGSSFTVSATPDASYVFAGWSEDASGLVNPLTINNVTSLLSITPAFALNSGYLRVTFNDGGSGATYSISGPAGFNSGSPLTGQTDSFYQVVPAGNYTVSFSAETGYELNLGSSSFTLASDQASGAIALADSETITATYSVQQFTVTINSTTNGSTDKDGANTVNYGENFTVNANPAANYRFSHWTGDVTGSDDPLTINNITEDFDITPVFEKLTGTLNVNITAGSSGGSYTIAGPAEFNSGNPISGRTDNYSAVVPVGDYTVTFSDISGFDISLSTDTFSVSGYQASGTLASDASETIGGVYGNSFDINKDGSVTPGDALLVLKHYLGTELLTDPVSLARADANGDEAITPGDALIVLQAYLGSV